MKSLNELLDGVRGVRRSDFRDHAGLNCLSHYSGFNEDCHQCINLADMAISGHRAACEKLIPVIERVGKIRDDLFEDHDTPPEVLSVLECIDAEIRAILQGEGGK